jgi:hypothetical protein
LRGKSIGDDVARDVEKQYELEYGWMDNPHPTDIEQRIARAYRGAHEKLQRAVEKILDVEPSAPPQDREVRPQKRPKDGRDIKRAAAG